jgi:microcystin-dependent protein
MDTIGEIRLFAGTYTPVGWVFCDGSSLNIDDYTSLFQLIGTTYGGDGNTTFNVPDLQSRAPIGAGQGTGLPNYNLGDAGGTEGNTLTMANVPAHTHVYRGTGILISCEDGYKTTLAGNYMSVSDQNIYSTIADSKMADAFPGTITIGNAGTATPAPVANVQPYLTISYIICCDGMYPTP